MFNKEKIDSLEKQVISDRERIKEKIDSLEKQVISDRERIWELEQKMFALQDLLDLSFTPRIVEVKHKTVGGFELGSEVNIEPAKYTFVNRFTEKVKKNKEKKVVNKKKSR